MKGANPHGERQSLAKAAERLLAPVDECLQWFSAAWAFNFQSMENRKSSGGFA
jgi:hypothetical protein